MSKTNNGIEPGFIQCSDLSSGNVSTLEHIELDNDKT